MRSRPVRGRGRSRLRRRGRGLRPFRLGGATEPGSTPASGTSTASCSGPDSCIPVECRATAASSAALYGLALGAAFFSESMFHLRARRFQGRPRASGGAAAVGRLPALDTQFVTPHLASLGRSPCRGRLSRMLDAAVAAEADFLAWPATRRISGRRALAAFATQRDTFRRCASLG